MRDASQFRALASLRRAFEGRLLSFLALAVAAGSVMFQGFLQDQPGERSTLLSYSEEQYLFLRMM